MKITREQYDRLVKAHRAMMKGHVGFNELLEQITGISYENTFLYFKNGKLVGCGDKTDVISILENAGIEIEDEERNTISDKPI